MILVSLWRQTRKFWNDKKKDLIGLDKINLGAYRWITWFLKKHDINSNPKFDKNYKLRLSFSIEQNENAKGFLDDWCGYRFPEINTLYLVDSLLINEEMRLKLDNFFENVYKFKLQILHLLKPQENTSTEMMQLYYKIMRRAQKIIFLYSITIQPHQILSLFGKLLISKLSFKNLNQNKFDLFASSIIYNFALCSYF